LREIFVVKFPRILKGKWISVVIRDCDIVKVFLSEVKEQRQTLGQEKVLRRVLGLRRKPDNLTHRWGVHER
jgi:hypothetical protein